MPWGRWEADSFEGFDLSRNPQMAPALERCRAVAEGRVWCAMLYGGYGTGKTHLAIAALKAYLASDGWPWHGYFWKVPDFLAWMRRSTFDEGWDLDDLVWSYRYGPGGLIVFDDLGTENPTDWACEQLYRVLDSRYDAKLPTIITSNAPLEAIDGRIRSRFREGLIVCEGRDVRVEDA